MSMNWLELAVLFLVAALVTVALVPAAKKLAVKLGAIDYPSARRVNMMPIPRLGGFAIFGGMVAALIVLQLGVAFFHWHMPFMISMAQGTGVNYVGVAVGVAFIFLVGAVDDVIDLRPRIKLAGQVVAACIVAASGCLLSGMQNPFGPDYIEFGPIISFLITVFYLVAFANVINLIDGLDGLAAGITGISGITIFILAVTTGRPDAAIFSAILVGSCVGFLKDNFHPASIFMGDSGALLLGFSLGVISLFAVARSALFVSLLVPILAAGVPILDTFFAIVRRKREHRRIDEADKGHIHHRLMRAGFSQRNTVLIMWAWTLMLSVCAVVVTETDNWVRIPIAVVAIAITVYAIVKLRLLGDALSHHFNPRQKPVPASAKREADQGAEGLAAEGAEGAVAGDGAGSAEGAASSATGTEKPESSAKG